MIAIIRLLAVLLGTTPPEEPMSRLLALDEAAFASCVRDRRSESAGRNVPGVGHGLAHVGVSA
ncbi:hypothetical protein [Streptomyces sp. A 4/2]|uniref:hypothetical protein n=1 Tax=Streptomyces sp. A 4/2 TaxID=2934314 RepID=UPI0020245F52|nr:hypothetical protein [Streptomyces sp. A 4/2]